MRGAATMIAGRSLVLGISAVVACGDAAPDHVSAEPPAQVRDCTGRVVVRLGEPTKRCSWFPDGVDLVVEHDGTGNHVRERLGSTTFRSDAWEIDAACRISLHRDGAEGSIHVEIGATTATLQYVERSIDERTGKHSYCVSDFSGSVKWRTLAVADVSFDEATARSEFLRAWTRLESRCPDFALATPGTSSSMVGVEVDPRGYVRRLTIDGATLDLESLRATRTSDHPCAPDLWITNPTGKPQRFAAELPGSR